jgi:hypothetical protein
MDNGLKNQSQIAELDANQGTSLSPEGSGNGMGILLLFRIATKATFLCASHSYSF